jgi:hypothetical protein
MFRGLLICIAFLPSPMVMPMGTPMEQATLPMYKIATRRRSLAITASLYHVSHFVLDFLRLYTINSPLYFCPYTVFGKLEADMNYSINEVQNVVLASSTVSRERTEFLAKVKEAVRSREN